MSDIEFVTGLFVKAPHANAPSFVKAAISIKREEMIGWLQARTGEWINIGVNESKGGKWYAAVNQWKPDGKASPQPAPPSPNDDAPDDTEQFEPDDIPF